MFFFGWYFDFCEWENSDIMVYYYLNVFFGWYFAFCKPEKSYIMVYFVCYKFPSARERILL